MGKRDYYNRKSNTRKTRQRFLIVCEGAETEPNYFKSFLVPADVIVDVRGEGRVTLSLVNRAIEIKNENLNDPYDQVWCVLDQDSNPKNLFDQALERADREGIKMAYSVESFEIWYILHFQYRNTAISRFDCEKILTDLLRKNNLLSKQEKYMKNRKDMYKKLELFQPTAIQNATRLLCSHSGTNPYDANPSTTVHELVEELNKNSRP
jgi:RloB-like protein